MSQTSVSKRSSLISLSSDNTILQDISHTNKSARWRNKFQNKEIITSKTGHATHAIVAVDCVKLTCSLHSPGECTNRLDVSWSTSAKHALLLTSRSHLINLIGSYQK